MFFPRTSIQFTPGAIRIFYDSFRIMFSHLQTSSLACDISTILKHNSHVPQVKNFANFKHVVPIHENYKHLFYQFD